MDRTRAPAVEPRRRTGGRSARVVHDVLGAAVDVLARTGYAGLSFEEVAARAGVSRTTIYRRWPTKADLVRAALLRMAEAHPQAPDTGALRSDLLAEARVRLEAGDTERDRGLIRALMAESANPEVAALARVVRERFEAPLFAAVERAIARGELPRGTDPQLVFGPVFSTLHLRICVFGDELPPGYVERLVDLVLAGARAGAAVPPAQR